MLPADAVSSAEWKAIPQADWRCRRIPQLRVLSCLNSWLRTIVPAAGASAVGKMNPRVQVRPIGPQPASSSVAAIAGALFLVLITVKFVPLERLFALHCAEDIPQSDPHRCRQPQSNDSVGFCGQERCRCNARLGPMRLIPILRTCFAMAGASQCAPEQAEGCRVALVQECRAWLLERKLSPSTLNLRLSSLRQLEPRRQRCTFGLDRALYSSARLGYLSPQLLYCRPSLPTSSRM